MTITSQLGGNHSPQRKLPTYIRSLTNYITQGCIINLTTRRKSQSLEKTTDIQQVTDKQYHIKLYQYNLTTSRKSQYLEKTTDMHQVQCLKWTVAQSPNATNILFGRPKAAPNQVITGPTKNVWAIAYQTVKNCCFTETGHILL